MQTINDAIAQLFKNYHNYISHHKANVSSEFEKEWINGLKKMRDRWLIEKKIYPDFPTLILVMQGCRICQ